MARTLQSDYLCRVTIPESQPHLARLAAGVIPLWVVTVRLSRGDAVKEYQRFADRHAGVPEFNRLVPAHHHTGFSLSISGIRNGSDRTSATVRAEEAFPNVKRIVGRISLITNEELVPNKLERRRNLTGRKQRCGPPLRRI